MAFTAPVQGVAVCSQFPTWFAADLLVAPATIVQINWPVFSQDED
jgi:hypothetical protein